MVVVIGWITSILSIPFVAWKWLAMFLYTGWMGVTEKKWIASAVQLMSIDIDPTVLNKTEPQLAFTFFGINAAISVIEMRSVSGCFRIGGDDIPGDIRFVFPPSSPKTVKRLERFAFTVSQWIPLDVAKRIVTISPGENHKAISMRGVEVKFGIVGDKVNEFKLIVPDTIEVDVSATPWHAVNRLCGLLPPVALSGERR